MANPAGRRSRQPQTVAEIEAIQQTIAELARKIGAVKAGMKATKQTSLNLDFLASMNKGIDLINDFADGALKTLRDFAPRGQRPWDEWDLGSGHSVRQSKN